MTARRPASVTSAGPVERSELARDSLDVAPWLLNKLLVRGTRVLRIVEVEAYRGTADAASHAFKGPTKRNATMFGAPGHLYVYFTYGMHWCANVVCGPEGTALAVLMRGGSPLAGLELMRAARPAAKVDRDLCNGPAKLCQAMGITGALDGVDLVGWSTGAVGGRVDRRSRSNGTDARGPRGAIVDGPVRIMDDGTPPPRRPGRGVRVGIRAAADRPWRWWVPADANVSRGDGRPGRRTGQPRGRVSRRPPVDDPQVGC